MKRTIVLVGALAAVAAAVPGAAPAASVSGVVVARSGHLLAVASPSGLVRTVHAPSRVEVGSRVRMIASPAKQGTFAASRVAVTGRATHARLHGVLIRRIGRISFVAAGHSILALRAGPRTLSSVSSGPAPGTVEDTTVSIGSQGQLQQQSLQTLGHVQSVQVQAVVSAVGAGTITVMVNGQPLTLQLPTGLTLPSSLVGQTVQLTLNLAGATPTATQAEHDDDQGDNNDNDDNDDDSGGNGDD
jgi:hypothetical protein